jgi:hypothetical protein
MTVQEMFRLLWKVKLPLCLIKHHDKKTYGEMEMQLHALIISAPDRLERLVSRPDHFAP